MRTRTVTEQVSGAGLPAVPTNIVRTGRTATSMTFRWTPGEGSAPQEYHIERVLVADGSRVGLPEQSGGVTEYEDTGLEPNRFYRYRMRACALPAGCSDWAESPDWRTDALVQFERNHQTLPCQSLTSLHVLQIVGETTTPRAFRAIPQRSRAIQQQQNGDSALDVLGVSRSEAFERLAVRSDRR